MTRFSNLVMESAVECADFVIQAKLAGMDMQQDLVNHAINVLSYADISIKERFNLTKEELWEYFHLEDEDEDFESYTSQFDAELLYSSNEEIEKYAEEAINKAIEEENTH